MTKKHKAKEVEHRLAEFYKSPVCMLLYRKPYELLIAARLSAQCTDLRVNLITRTLFDRFPTLESFADSDLTELEKLIFSCGLYKTKARDIQQMSRRLIEQFDGQIPDNMEALLSLPGVGRKTANLILGDVYKKPAVVTDTHFIRITNRLGLTATKNPLKVEKDLRALLTPETSSDFCHRIVFFGREVCKSQNPRCETCILSDLCRFYQNKKGV